MTTPVLWRDLRRFTPARVGLGRTGNSLPTTAHLEFQAAHAAARDAVHTELDIPALQTALAHPTTIVQSAAPDRRTYLLRPDLGRKLATPLAPSPAALGIVIADGLSALAAQRHAAPMIHALLAELAEDAPIIIARQARVALGDAIGAALGVEAIVVLIGERPGLSTPDSLGAYLTWNPHPGRTDAERNCISNIRTVGLPPARAAGKLAWLIRAMRGLRLTGVELKDEEPVGRISEAPSAAQISG